MEPQMQKSPSGCRQHVQSNRLKLAGRVSFSAPVNSRMVIHNG